MIVDANVLLYFHINHPDYSAEATKAIEAADRCFAPELWRSELRSALFQYVASEKATDLPGSELTLEKAIEHMAVAERIVTHSFSVGSEEVLRLAYESGCSPYDCEYVQLAQEMELALVTYDRKLQRAFPNVALSPRDYLGR